jgi:hypothetical protein
MPGNPVCQFAVGAGLDAVQASANYRYRQSGAVGLFSGLQRTGMGCAIHTQRQSADDGEARLRHGYGKQLGVGRTLRRGVAAANHGQAFGGVDERAISYIFNSCL